MNKFIKKIKNNQVLYVLSILIIGILLLLIARITYAYLAPRIQSALSNITTISDTVDDFKLELGRPLSLNATSTTLPESGSNLVVTSTEIAKLKANSTKKTANYNYYLYLQITNNTFKYSDGTTPEIILTITDPNGNEITSLDNLTYGTYNGVSGFDVTTKTGLFAIANNYEITSNSSTTYTEHDWNITLTYLNLNIDQSGNYGNSFETKLYLQKEEKELTIADVCPGKSLSDCVIAQYTGIKNSNIYYHDSNLTNGAGDNSYRYAGANPNNYVCFGSDEATCPTENLYRIIGVIDGKVKLIHAYGATTTMLGTDGGYIKTYQALVGNFSQYYKGNGDLTKIGSYKWNKSGTNTWSTSTTNTTNLNINFLTYLDGKNAKWKTMIDDTTWYVGGMTSTNGYKSNAKTAYNYEVGANKDATTTVTSKIGLMYVSEYYYGSTPDYWTLPGNDPNGSWNSDYTVWSGNDYSKAYNDNWMSTGLTEWTISRNSGVSDSAFAVIVFGNLAGGGVGSSSGGAVRPSFSLSSSIKFTSGEGTAVNPIRINL